MVHCFFIETTSAKIKGKQAQGIMAYKIRVQKKKEVEPLKIASRSEERLQSLLARPGRIWGGLAVLVLIAFAVFTWQSQNKNAEEAAWILEAEASKFFHEPPPLPEPIEEGQEDAPLVLLDPIDRLKRSAEIYDEIIDKHPNRRAAAIARFESGNVYYALESYDKAEERFVSFIQRHADRSGLVRLAEMKLAYLYLKTGNREKATDRFKNVYKVPDAINKDQAGFELARLLEADEKVDEALAIYTDVSTNFPKSPWGTEAKVRLTGLNPPKTEDILPSEESVSDNKDSSISVDQEKEAAPSTAQPVEE